MNGRTIRLLWGIATAAIANGRPAAHLPRRFLSRPVRSISAARVKYYEVIGDSGSIVRRGFCPNCGARLFGKPTASPNIMSIMAGSLDDPSWFQPQADIYAASAQPWDYMNPDLPKFPGLPQT
jgi:hypothetical protein